jgi:hypothetical protein
MGTRASDSLRRGDETRVGIDVFECYLLGVLAHGQEEGVEFDEVRSAGDDPPSVHAESDPLPAVLRQVGAGNAARFSRSCRVSMTGSPLGKELPL